MFGLGHLSRCLCLAKELVKTYKISFIIKSDDQLKVTTFINTIFNSDNTNVISFIDKHTTIANEILFIIDEVTKNNSFLILDHYEADESYQKRLYENNIKWLQFDSHALINFYATFILHGSPDATNDKYLPLLINKKAELLLGTKYAIVGENFRKFKKVNYRTAAIQRVLLCFGGGDDNNATFKCLSLLNLSEFDSIEFYIVISDLNQRKEDILKIASNHANVVVSINESQIYKEMNKSDLAIISPGTLSYEAACIALPMLLISIADNQMINASGWVRIEAAKYLGTIDNLNTSCLNQELRTINEDVEGRIKMHHNCLSAIDGNGVVRIKNRIDKFIG